MKLLERFFGHRRALRNVTPPAQQVLVLARQEADRLFHSFVGTEHLLLGLLLVSDGAAALKSVGIDPVGLKIALEGSLLPGERVDREKVLPATPRVMQVLKAGAKEANLLGHGFLTTEHMVLGLLRVRKGMAWESLRGFSVTIEEARAKVRALLAIRPEMPNQSLEPTTMAVTPPAAQEPRQP